MNTLGQFALFGFLGWVLENAFSDYAGPRHSQWVPGKLPFYPAYAIGGLLVLHTAPRMKQLPIPVRAVIYAGGLSALELGACKLERAMGVKQWSYENGACVDVMHALAWGGLALLVEGVGVKS